MATATDLLSELQTFIKQTTNLNTANHSDLTKTALRLLRYLPASRSAIFDYLSHVFEKLTEHHITKDNDEKSTVTPIDTSILDQINATLLELIEEQTATWAPLISTWSLGLLGDISSKFASHHHQRFFLLNDILQLWLDCRATKILVDINTKCLTSLMCSETETCISALLETSIRHSPNFDWVVAYVGRCFPNVVITRVLGCGLRDFAQIKSREQGTNSVKLKSVVGILEHLSRTHTRDIQRAVVELFQSSLTVPLSRKNLTVPYLLHLSLLSSAFYHAFSRDVTLFNLTVSTVKQLSVYVEDWCRYFGSTDHVLEDIFIDLIVDCIDGLRLIDLTLDCVNAENCTDLRDCAIGLIQSVLYRIDDSVRASKPLRLFQHDPIKAQTIFTNLQMKILNGTEMDQQVAAQLLIYYGHSNCQLFLQSVRHLLTYAEQPAQLQIVLGIVTHDINDSILTAVNANGNGLLSVVVGEALINGSQMKQTLLNNLRILLEWEGNSADEISVFKAKPVTDALHNNLHKILDYLCVPMLDSNAHTLIDILVMMTNSNCVKMTTLENCQRLALGTVNYFLWRCVHNDVDSLDSVVSFKNVCSIIHSLCTHSIYAKSVRVVIIRELLESVLQSSASVLFGGNTGGEVEYEVGDDCTSLLEQNFKVASLQLSRHSSLLNGGVIGRGKRKEAEYGRGLDAQQIQDNICELINVLRACCALPIPNNNGNNPELTVMNNRFVNTSLESVTLVSLQLVQLVSPDVMYNGLPWPDEEFTKVTVERDLTIMRRFITVPVLWDVLRFVAAHRPALCYCSVLLRAMIATLLHQWRSVTNEKIARNCPAQLSMTVKVLDLMALGQLLPPPLASINAVLPYLKCHEVVDVLRDCVWCYMRDHVPSPALFTVDPNTMYWRDPIGSRPAQHYTNTLRVIMQRNIEQVGHLYGQMFIHVPTHD